MKASGRINSFLALLLAWSVFYSTACTLNFDVTSAEPYRISGSVDMTQISSMSSCSEPDSVSIYAVVNGSQSETAVQKVSLKSDGSFTFSIETTDGTDILTTGRYVLQAQVCGKTLSRPVTGASDQTIDYTSNFLAIVAKANITGIKSLNQISTSELKDILSQISALTVNSTKETYDTVIDGSHNSLKQNIETVFNISDLSLVKDATAPEVVSLTQPSSFAEGSSANYSVTASHWYYSSSDIVYDWRWDGNSESTADSLSLSLSKNSQGTHSLLMQIGFTDGSGAIDAGKAVYSKAFSVKVPNTFPAIVPAATLTSSTPTNSNAVTISLNNGASLENCATFSKIAITENPTSLGLTDSDFSKTCTTTGTQSFSYTLSPSEGVKSIYIWAKDSSGYISTSPRILSVILDQTAPSVSLGSIAALYRGGQSISISYGASDILTNISSLKLQFVEYGTVTDVAELASLASPYTTTIPALNTTANLKLVATDEAGNTAEVSSSAFVIDSGAPAAPSLTLLSAALTSDPLVSFNIQSCTDFSAVYISESATAPTLASSGWLGCSTTVPYSTTVSGDSTHTIRVWTQDAAGNISATAATLSVTLDTTAPTLAWTAPTADVAVNTSVAITWKVTDLHTTTSQNTVLSYSTDAGSTWTTLSTQSLPASSASSQSYTFSITSPSVTTSIILKAQATDAVGNIGTSTKSLVVESQAPTLLSLTLAGGSSIVGLPSVSAQLSVTSATSATTYMRLAESSDLSAVTWIPYTALAFSYELSKTAGTKTVYAQVKNSAGFESNVVNSDIALEFGAPPVVSVTSPTAAGGPYVTGNNFNIQWTCTTSGSTTLSSTPISISYSADDGISYQTVVTGIANSGSYSWSVPSGITSITPLKVLVSCESSAGVVSTGLSEIANSSWKNLIGSPGNMDYGIHINSADLSNWTSVHGDSSNNLYSGSKNGIIKVNRKTGIVEQWLGTLGTKGCPTSSSTPSNVLFTAPRIIDITNDQITVISAVCHTISRINISDRSIAWTRTVAEISWPENQNYEGFYLRKDSGYYYFPTIDSSSYTISYRMIDLSSTSSSSVLVIGDGAACASTLPAAGASAITAKTVCTVGTNNTIVVSQDQKTISYYYMPSSTSANSRTLYTYDSGTGGYIVVNSGTTSSLSEAMLSRCNQIGSDSSKYICVNGEGQSRTLNYYDTSTYKAATTTTHALSTFNSSGAMQLRMGTSNTSAYAISQVTNELFEVKFKSDGTLTSSLIGGTPFSTFGNGSDPSKVAFTQIMGVVYSAANSSIYVRGINHVRRMTVDTTALKITQVDTAMNTGGLGNSSAFGGLAVNKTGTSLAVNSSASGVFPWRQLNLASWSSTVNASTNAYTVSDGNTYYGGGATYDAATLTLGGSFAYNYAVALRDKAAAVSYLSDGYVYFSAASDQALSQNLWIYRSKGNNASDTITSVAGATGATGQAATLSAGVGSAAIGTSFKRIYGMQPSKADGSGNTDLLIFDAQRMRRASFITESSSPKVYDEIDFTTLPNYPGDITWSHAVYDTSTTWTYFVVSSYDSSDGKTHIWAAHPTTGFEEIPLNGLNVPGVYISNMGHSISLEISPLGLLVMDTTNKRILSIALKN